ncbi:MAG: alkaline phosphatase D family protein [Sphingomonadales bacterium]
MKFRISAAAIALAVGFAAWSFADEGSDRVAASLPSSDSLITRIAFGSCADEVLPQPIWSTIAKSDPDLFLFIGDNVYADIYKGRWVDGPNLEAIEYAYKTLGARRDFRAFRQKVPMMVTWDDHDYGFNDAGAEFPLKAKSKDLMLDFFEVPEDAAVRGHDGVYNAAIFGPEGQRVQIILLDTRWFRSTLKPTDEMGAPGKERYLPEDDPSKTMLGDEQWAWLEEQLGKPAELRLLVSSIQVIADGHGWERWGNLPRERERLYQLIRETGAENVILLSGDRHIGGFYRLEGVSDYPLYEFTSSSINKSFAMGATVPEYGPHQMGHLYGPENFGLISVDWGDQILNLELKNIAGKTVRAVTMSLDDLKDH